MFHNQRPAHSIYNQSIRTNSGTRLSSRGSGASSPWESAWQMPVAPSDPSSRLPVPLCHFLPPATSSSLSIPLVSLFHPLSPSRPFRAGNRCTGRSLPRLDRHREVRIRDKPRSSLPHLDRHREFRTTRPRRSGNPCSVHWRAVGKQGGPLITSKRTVLP